MPSNPHRHRVVPRKGDDSNNGSACCPSQPSLATSALRRSPSSSRCHQRRSAAGPRRAGCPSSAPWAATVATPTPRSGPCWKPCPSYPRPASHAPRPTTPASPLTWLDGRPGTSSARSKSCRTGTRRLPPCEICEGTFFKELRGVEDRGRRVRNARSVTGSGPAGQPRPTGWADHPARARPRRPPRPGLPLRPPPASPGGG